MKTILIAGLLFASCAAAAGPAWEEKLAERIPLYGHRNWIVIADSAYPAQTSDGIETIVVNANQVSVLKHVLAALDASKHVRPIVYTDAELKFLDPDDVPGIAPYRETLADLFRNRETHTLRHEEVIHKLDEAGQTFRVLIIKTNMTMPYTSVFLQLDCAYWGPDNEKKLRALMAGSQ
jgi:L-fucose mutarotase/ribose pyranase (RbsD/FucU family)